MHSGDSAYHLWLQHEYFDPATRQELAGLAENPGEVAERFGRRLPFGTAGLRGIIGAGTNRMNRYTIRLASWALGRSILQEGEAAAARGAVIAYDSRRFSADFALEAALTLNALGVRTFTWDSICPTPLLSFAVRELRAAAGVVITASHNPKEYNGFKVYGPDGGQIGPERAAALEGFMAGDAAALTDIVPMDREEAVPRGLLCPVPAAVDERYLSLLAGMLHTAPQERQACKVLYTPLHGAGRYLTGRALTDAGFVLRVVAAQAEPDPDFPTVPTPNPEDPAVFQPALAEAAVFEPDLIMATDADADRLGVLVREGSGVYTLLNGNQLGAVLADYLIHRGVQHATLGQDAVVVKSIATSNLVAGLCEAHGIHLVETHTGFKFIADLIQAMETTGSGRFLFGFEESYGYLAAPFVRDKDAVMAAALAADAAAFHKAGGRTLTDALEAIRARYGYFLEDLYTVTMPGAGGQAQMAALMERLRRDPPRQFGPCPVAFVDDYLAGQGIDCLTGVTYPLSLGTADVLHYRFADGGFVMLRPSGTEPKLKLYVSVRGSSGPGAIELLARVRTAALERIRSS